MKYENIRAVFDDKCRSLKIDSALIKKLERYKLEFQTKNQDHLAFFGSPLIGCYQVRFTPADRDKIFHELLRIDEKDVEKYCNDFIPKKTFQIAGDVANIALVWLAHAIIRSSLSEKDKTNGSAICLEIMQYKFLTSRMWRHWRYTCTEAESEALLAALSNKYIIKQKGSWNKYIRDRALEVADTKTSIHRQTLLKMDKDISLDGKGGQTVAYLIGDMQSRIRDMLKNLFDVFLKVHDQGKKISGSSKIAVFDGQKTFKDDFSAAEKLKNYIHTIVPDKNSFLKTELIGLIVDVLPTMPPHYLVNTLEWMSDNYTSNKDKKTVEETINLILEHAIIYLSRNNDFLRNQHDISYLLSKMKGIYSSSRSSDEKLIEVRKKVEALVTLGTGSKSPAVVSATRNGVCLYVLLRTFTMSYYSS